MRTVESGQSFTQEIENGAPIARKERRSDVLLRTGEAIHAAWAELQKAHEADVPRDRLKPLESEYIEIRSLLEGQALSDDDPDLLFGEPTEEEAEELSQIERQEMREQLITTFASAWQRLEEKREQLRGKAEFPKVAFTGGGLAIEGQTIALTEYPDSICLSFKLADHHYQSIVPELRVRGKKKELAYPSAIQKGKKLRLKSAYFIEEQGLDVRVAAPLGKVQETLLGNLSIHPVLGGGRTHAADRMVTISLRKEAIGTSPDFAFLVDRVQSVMKTTLDLDTGLCKPSVEEEALIKRYALAEHHTLSIDEVSHTDSQKIKRVEVFPGRMGYIEEGKHREYQRLSPYAIYHRIAFGATVGKARQTIVRILEGDGLMSTMERLSRGIIFEGTSSSGDIQSGGAESAFTRVVTRDGLKGANEHTLGYFLVLDPALLDRTDWYAYEWDKYGSTDPDWYQHRSSPAQFMQNMKEKYRRTNEVMFPGGVPTKHILGIKCNSDKERENLLEDLRAAGLKEVNGKPIETFVFVGKFGDMISFSQKETPIPVRQLERKKRALGTNEGGVYEDPNTKERFYVKLYKNPDQAKVEYLANAIYTQAGIAAPASELFELKGRLAIGSSFLEGGASLSLKEIEQNQELQKGFIVDAFLGNWDVIGQNGDNIMKAANGELVRIDNGGSLSFRARGLKKVLEEDTVPELDTMRKKEFPSGRVFGSLTEDDLRIQARLFIERVSEADIERLIASSHLSLEDEKDLKHLLIARRQALIRRFNLTASAAI